MTILRKLACVFVMTAGMLVIASSAFAQQATPLFAVFNGGTLDIALRLGAATLVGAVLGLNRDLHGKPTGVRTLGLVCLGAALAVLSVKEGSSADASRIIQGIMTGVGFLGAGVIVRNSKGQHVHGLTTAACVWVTACIGAACAVAKWQIVVVGAFLVLVILVFGGPFEKAIDRRWPAQKPTGPGQETRSTTRVPSSEPP